MNIPTRPRLKCLIHFLFFPPTCPIYHIDFIYKLHLTSPSGAKIYSSQIYRLNHGMLQIQPKGIITISDRKELEWGTIDWCTEYIGVRLIPLQLVQWVKINPDINGRIFFNINFFVVLSLEWSFRLGERKRGSGTIITPALVVFFLFLFQLILLLCFYFVRQV